MTDQPRLRVGFLACPETLPDSANRRSDAFEHDLQVAALRSPLEERGFDLIEIDWYAPMQMLTGMAAVVLGTAWNYQDALLAFTARLEALRQHGVMVCNPPEVVRWNAKKRYLRDLEQRGATTIPTLWLRDVDKAGLDFAFDHFDCAELVVKREVGAGALGQLSFTRGEPVAEDWQFGQSAMVQPMLQSVIDEGEQSFIFIDGEFSHCVRKLAAEGDYRIQSMYGGSEEALAPDPADLAAAKAVHDLLPFDPQLYARIDMVRLPSGDLAVMEAEMIEPYLYPEQGPELGEHMARGIARRLAEHGEDGK